MVVLSDFACQPGYNHPPFSVAHAIYMAAYQYRDHFEHVVIAVKNSPRQDSKKYQTFDLFDRILTQHDFDDQYWVKAYSREESAPTPSPSTMSEGTADAPAPGPAQEALPPVTGAGETGETTATPAAIALPDRERTIESSAQGALPPVTEAKETAKGRLNELRARSCVGRPN